MSRKGFIAAMVVMVLLSSTIIYYAGWLKSEALSPWYIVNRAGKRIKVLPVDKSIVQISYTYTGDSFSIGDGVKNIKIDNLAAELKKNHIAHPDAKYQVVWAGKCGDAIEVRNEIKKAGIKIEHFWEGFNSTPPDDMEIRLSENGFYVVDRRR